jgi:MFS transporter, UMF1 family
MKDSSNNFKIFIWSLFDFANTSYSIVVVTFIYAVYFKDVVALGKPIGDLYWSIGISISMLISGIIAPILGAIADYSAGKKRFLLFFSLLSIISTALLFFVQEGMIFWGLTLFILANIGFESGLVFYDSFLPELTTPKNYGRVSGYGFAFGYFGSLASLAIAFPFIQADMIRETFPVSALFFLIFGIPLFIFLKDTRRKVKVTTSFINIGFRRVKNTLIHLREYKNLALYLLAFFFYIEGVNTTIFFSGNFARTSLGFSLIELAIFFLIVQTTAILGSVLFGILSDSIGQKKSIVISLYIWIFTMILAFTISDSSSSILIYFADLFNSKIKEFQVASFYIVGLLAGSVMGATQSTSRSMMTKLTPAEKKTEFFGFYSLFGKSSAIIGPLVFGIISYTTESQSYAILSISLFFIVGLFILRFVKDAEVSTS